MDSLTTEVSFAQRLAGNTKKIRDRALKKLRNYMKSKSTSKKGGFSKEDLLKLWKGLHYCLWMQDKAIIQEELNIILSQLVHNLATVESQLMFIQVFFITEAREWNSIDVWRLDKFMTLVRNMLHESLMVIKKQKWQREHLQRLGSIFGEEVMSPTSQTIPDGLKMHFADMYLDEVEKIGGNQLTGDQLVLLLEPFIQYVRAAKNTEVVKRVISRVFHPVITRAVELLKKRNEGETQQADEEGELEETEIPLQSLKFDNSLLADRLFEVSKQSDMLSRNRPLIYRLVQKLQDVDKGVLPSARKVVIGPGVTDRDVAEAAQQLAKLDKPKKRKKKRKSTGDSDSDNEGKENDSSDQNNNDDTLPVFETPDIQKSSSDAVNGNQKRKLSVDNELGTDVPVKKMKRKSIDNGSDKKPLNKLRKLLKSKKENTKKSVDITLTPVTRKAVTAKQAAVGSGWTVTAMEKDIDDSDANQVSGSVNCTGTKSTKKMPPKLVINQVVADSTKAAGQKRTHSESSGTASSSQTTDLPTKTETPLVNTPVWTEEIQEGEVEIFVPSKKYKGKVDANPKQGFASFDQSKAPVAYVKKSPSKTPKSSKYVKGKTASINSAKRVSFDMKKNKSQGFKESLKSPMTPYNPYKRPDQGILKTPEATKTPTTIAVSEPQVRTRTKKPVPVRMAATPGPTIISTKPMKKATPMKRAKARDFFYL